MSELPARLSFHDGKNHESEKRYEGEGNGANAYHSNEPHRVLPRFTTLLAVAGHLPCGFPRCCLDADAARGEQANDISEYSK
jgi:hypothetical protein